MSSNYPLGAENDINAPFNQSGEEEIEQIQVTCSNTLSKDFAIDAPVNTLGQVPDDCNLLMLFQEQDFSAKEALDLAVKYSEEATKLAKLLWGKYPNIAARLSQKANALWGACENWNEDEIEVVQV